jgi:hypothetical protein
VRYHLEFPLSCVRGLPMNGRSQSRRTGHDEQGRQSTPQPDRCGPFFRVTHRTSFHNTRDVYSRRGRTTSHLFDCDRIQACCITFEQPGRSVAKHKPPSTTPSYEWLPAFQPAMGKLYSWLISGVEGCGGRHPIGRQERQRPEPGCSGAR